MDNGSSEQAADANDADVMFASMVIVHHQQAIQMSDIVLAKDGVHHEVVELAEAIKTAQGPEIEQLQGWLDDWGVDPDGGHLDGMDRGDGIMTEDDLATLCWTTRVGAVGRAPGTDPPNTLEGPRDEPPHHAAAPESHRRCHRNACRRCRCHRMHDIVARARIHPHQQSSRRH